MAKNDEQESVQAIGLQNPKAKMRSGRIGVVLKFISHIGMPAFLFCTVFFTGMLFAVSQQKVSALIAEQKEMSLQRSVEIIVQSAQRLERDFHSFIPILSMYKDIPRTSIVNKLRQNSNAFENFDQLLWIYKTNEGQWQAASIFERSADQSNTQKIHLAFKLKPDHNLINALKAQQNKSNGAAFISTNLNFLSKNNDQTLDVKLYDLKPFAIIQPLVLGDENAGWIVGTTSIALAVYRYDPHLLDRVNIRDVNTGYEFLLRKNDSQAYMKSSQSYEFNFLGAQLDIRSFFEPSKSIHTLQSLPLVVLGFGGLIIVLGFVHFHIGNMHKSRERLLKKALKNSVHSLEIEKEIQINLNQTLEQTEQENRAIIDAVSDVIFELDTEGKIAFLSAAWAKVTGFTLDQSQGLEFFKMLHQQDQDYQSKEFNMLLRGQKQAYRSFARLRTVDGNFRAVELAFSMMRQDKNKNIRVVGTITDVEERRRVERALSEAEKKYRAIVENAAGGIYQFTPEGLYLSANPSMARILGYSGPDEMLRTIKNANESVYTDIRERQRFIFEVERRGSISGYETQVLRKDGSTIWVNENIRAVRDENNNTLYYEGSIEDISVRKKSEIAMREAKIKSDMANRAKSEFLSNMSHELRTPLNAIIGFSEIIKNEAFGPIGNREYWEYVKDIHQSGKNLLKIINEILDISKIEAGERQLNETMVNLNDVVEACLSLLSNKIEDSKMSISVSLRDLPQVIAEELAIKQILMNLLSNAIKFTPQGGRITINGEIDSDKQLRLSVTDTGVGLDPEEIQKALSPFGQVDTDLSRKGSGTGLGLTLVDALIKLHGGEFELFSQKGIGTTATIIFPKQRVTVKKAQGVNGEAVHASRSN